MGSRCFSARSWRIWRCSSRWAASNTYARWLPMGNKAAIDGLDDKGTTRRVRDQGHSPEVGP